MAPVETNTQRFSLRIILPAILVLVGAVATVVVSLDHMASTVNSIEGDLTRRSVQAAVRASIRRVTDSHGDYAVWDDAVRKLYGTVDEAFVADNFVATTADPVFFDTAYVLDENKRLLVAYRNGKPTSVAADIAFGPSLQPMLAGVPSDGRSYDVRSGIVRGKWGLAAIAVGPIVPSSTEFSNPPSHARYLILARDFDAKTVERISEDFVIDGLHVVAPNVTVPRRMVLRDPIGAPVGALTWSKPNLGTEATTRVTAAVIAMLALLVATMLLLIALAFQSWRRLTRSEQQALYAASHDKLTGLPNRTGLIEALEALRADQADWHYAIAFFDLDGFKEVNDAYGHATGDDLLRLIADGFKAISAGRILARVGGDEFAVVITGTNPEKEATELARSFIRYLAAPFDIDGRVITVGTSVGIATATDRQISPEEVFRRADVAMFEAKKQGPNRLDIYRAAIDTIRHERLAIADDLRRALQSESLTVEYQPIFDARTGRIVAAEALLRWFRPGHGDISPEVFIPIAEESGLIEELGTWVLRRATRDAAAWPEVRLAVNASPAQFRSPGFPLIVANLIAETGFPVRQLEIEMTESYFVSHPEQARSAIDALRRLGVNVALDDFGAGYASIGYLRDFDFGKIKLDRTMIAGITTDVRAQRLVHATISLADALDMTVTVEGVASDEEVALLRLAGARELQGFFLARPQTAEAFAALLDRRLADLPSGRWAKAG